MRHGKRVAKLGRTSDHRKAMLANLVTSLLDHEVVHTTEPRAKELRRIAERMIAFAKRHDLHSRRQVLRVVPDKRVVAKLFDDLADRYRSRNGGFTRVVKIGPRRGDGALMALVELVDRSTGGSSKPVASRAAREEEASPGAGKTES
ncbi:MAG: 50S ribosomal protein L17 [Candidatus Latescibacterota bacterium]